MKAEARHAGMSHDFPARAPDSCSISCVIDQQPKFYRQCVVWLRSLEIVDPERKLERKIFHVGSAPARFADFVTTAGAGLIEVEPFGQGVPPFSNKLQQMEHLVKSPVRHVVMSDADIAFLKSPFRLIDGVNVRAKLVDRPNPPPDRLRDLLVEVGFSKESLTATPDFAPDQQTHQLNCNGGLYIMTRQQVEELSGPWIKWTKYCAGQVDILGVYTLHAYQMGFMLAMLELGLPFSSLASRENFPTHFPRKCYSERVPEEICALHYHQNLDEAGQIISTGEPAIDKWILKANRTIGLSAERLATVGTLVAV